ncbi:unnamed protein product [Vitrella brassicaformis CCMP3155]|uniref:DUF1232 domain-containing protein n=1 Tax=Vitrella brassicaformis (strain CCMP3155) TaxID=1169540 RepID=A0A0G4F832_VITBC|nr:unnamed protein product [Vitrella brassicaformis CCMP3155]|eukprot:CEM08119.1 unnamed protein product [Vitrella brassicaformis CCMP3155]
MDEPTSCAALPFSCPANKDESPQSRPDSIGSLRTVPACSLQTSTSRESTSSWDHFASYFGFGEAGETSNSSSTRSEGKDDSSPGREGPPNAIKDIDMDDRAQWSELYFKLMSSTGDGSASSPSSSSGATADVSGGPEMDLEAMQSTLQLQFGSAARWLIRSAGGTVARVPLAMYYALRANASTINKVMLALALLYFCAPLDLVPDFILGAGLIDDLAVLGTVYAANSNVINDEHFAEADEFIREALEDKDDFQDVQEGPADSTTAAVSSDQDTGGDAICCGEGGETPVAAGETDCPAEEFKTPPGSPAGEKSDDASPITDTVK